jgi:MFS family permease
LPLLAVNFIGTLGFSIVLPFLVFLTTRFGGNELMYGLLGATYPAFQFFGAPVLGRWSDIYGRRRVLLLSQIGTFLAWLLFLLSLSLPLYTLFTGSGLLGEFDFTLPLLLLFIARAFDGLTGGNISVANAYLSDISDESNRKANFGKMGVSSSLGFVLGPAVAGVLGATVWGEALPVAVAAAVSLAAIFLIQFQLPESKADAVKPEWKFSLKRVFGFEQKECYEVENKEGSLKQVLACPHMPLLLTIYFLTFFGFSFFYAGFPVHALAALQWDSLQLGLFFSLLSGLMIVVQGPLLSYLSARVADRPLVYIGTAILVLTFIVIAIGDETLTYFSAILFALGNGLMWPSFLAILSKFGGTKMQGAVQGVANSAGSLASILGLIGGGFLYTYIGPATFYATSVVLVAVFVLSLRLPKPPPAGTVIEPDS